MRFCLFGCMTLESEDLANWLQFRSLAMCWRAMMQSMDALDSLVWYLYTESKHGILHLDLELASDVTTQMCNRPRYCRSCNRAFHPTMHRMRSQSP